MLSQIKEKYKIYNEIFYSLDSLELSNNSTAKILLENSLYLSVFTVFENFLKDLIQHYLDNISEKGIKFVQLSNGFACAIFLGHEKRINNIFNKTGENQLKDFNKYFQIIQNNLSKQDLAKYIHFEFLHESKLTGYYKDLFEQIIGEREFLTKLKLKEEFNDFDGLINIEGDAFTFLREYTMNVRNNIAHKNQTFKVDGFVSFDKVTDTFLFIMTELIKKYEKYNNFIFEENSKNILNEF